MRITDIIQEAKLSKRNRFSFELLPPLKGEGLRKDCQLCLSGKGLETWEYRNVDSGFVAFVAEADDTLGIIAYLRSDILCSSVNLLLEIAHVGEHIWRFHMLLWISSHTDAEVAVVSCVRLAVDEASCIHVHYLLYEGIGMRQAFRMWAETRVAVHSIASESQHIMYADEVEVDEGVFDVIA